MMRRGVRAWGGGTLIAAALASAAVASTAAAVERVQDGGFEGNSGAANPFWTGTNSYFCIPGCSAVEDGAPRTGGDWAVVGETSMGATASIQQEVTTPAGNATLTFYYRRFPYGVA